LFREILENVPKFQNGIQGSKGIKGFRARALTKD
jgi:hypothetical protein